MAEGPDPNRWQHPDPEIPPREEEEAEVVGSPPSTRLGLPAWAIVLLALVILAVVLVLTA